MPQKSEKREISETCARRVPALRFPEFAGSTEGVSKGGASRVRDAAAVGLEWEEKIFGDVFSFKRTNSLSRDALHHDSGEIRNIHYGDIHTKFRTAFDISREKVPFINNKTTSFAEDEFCQEGDIVIADASEDYKDIGKSVEVMNLGNEKVVAGLHTVLARDERNTNAKGFAGYMMQTWNVRHQMMRLASGISVLGLSKKSLSSIEVVLPKKEEQKKIAGFLGAVDEWIGILREERDALANYKRGMMQKLFSRTIRFKDDAGNDFPEWEEKKLGEILEESNERTEKLNQFEILSCSKDGIFRQSEYFKKQIASEKNEGYRILREGQLVFSPQNLWLGNLNVNIDYEVGMVSPSYKVFCIDSGIANVSFLKDFLRSPRMMHEYVQVSEQGASIVRRNLDVSLFSSIKIVLPSLPEQKKIADFLTALDDLLAAKSDEIARAEEWKKGLMQKMFV
ncbi:MAG: restriction endonuclease subunit S [Candidatus Moranbacteria bacterium]|nr:restriction endonuclease subunit S [Candidatus Moranbacteria bacterium]